MFVRLEEKHITGQRVVATDIAIFEKRLNIFTFVGPAESCSTIVPWLVLPRLPGNQGLVAVGSQGRKEGVGARNN